MEYTSIRDCAVRLIVEYGDTLKNMEIAEKVRQIMKSNTSTACIAWYKSKIKNGEIQVDPADGRSPEQSAEEIELKFDNEAEQYVYDRERERTGTAPLRVLTGGYDLELDAPNDNRHIEVKWKKKGYFRWLQLTARETEQLVKDPKFWLHLVEGTEEDVRSRNHSKISVLMVPQQDLLKMTQLKITARLTQFNNKKSRDRWVWKF